MGMSSETYSKVNIIFIAAEKFQSQTARKTRVLKLQFYKNLEAAGF